MALTVNLVADSATEYFNDVDVRQETPSHIYVRCMARGRKPSRKHVWIMTMPIVSGENASDFNDFITLEQNGVADGGTVLISER